MKRIVEFPNDGNIFLSGNQTLTNELLDPIRYPSTSTQRYYIIADDNTFEGL